MMRGLPFLVAFWLAVPAVADPLPKGLDGFVTVDRLPVPALVALAQGRTIWGGNCQNCHGGDKLTGAPKITAVAAWEPRIAQGIDVLVAHATDGFTGPRYTQMPARGGNPALSDHEVALAVAFMVWASGAPDAAIEFATQQSDKD